jgi:LuxR family transcriptional regulator
MPYGIVYASKTGDSLSICGFARADREFSNDEIENISTMIENLHKSTADQAHLSPETIQELKNMSILVTHPGS